MASSASTYFGGLKDEVLHYKVDMVPVFELASEQWPIYDSLVY